MNHFYGPLNLNGESFRFVNLFPANWLRWSHFSNNIFVLIKLSLSWSFIVLGYLQTYGFVDSKWLIWRRNFVLVLPTKIISLPQERSLVDEFWRRVAFGITVTIPYSSETANVQNNSLNLKSLLYKTLTFAVSCVFFRSPSPPSSAFFHKSKRNFVWTVWNPWHPWHLGGMYTSFLPVDTQQMAFYCGSE